MFHNHMLLASGAFSPLALFAASEVGAWYDPSDFSTMWQDNARTTPVTAVEQTVGCIDDKSGNGNHAIQATSGSRPVLKEDGGKYFLLFDGTDDWLATAAINFSATDEMSAFAGVRKLSETGRGIVAELSTNPVASVNSFSLFASRVDNAYTFASRGSPDGLSIADTAASYAAPTTNVLMGAADISGDTVSIRVDGILKTTGTIDQGTGNYGAAYPLYICTRGGTGDYLNGRLYSLIIRGKTSTADEITAAETWVNSKTGAY